MSSVPGDGDGWRRACDCIGEVSERLGHVRAMGAASERAILYAAALAWQGFGGAGCHW